MAAAGLRPTANRLLVLRALMAAHAPLSMSELEQELETLDKSSVFRVLMALLDAGLVHALEDGRGIVRYEICTGGGHHGADGTADLHVHFYCRQCHRVFCLSDVDIPTVDVPRGYVPQSVNYMVKGLCPECAKAEK